MARITVEESVEIQVPAAYAWALLGDFGGNHKWMPVVTRSEIEGSGIGATRRLSMPDNGYVDEREVERDELGMRYRYVMFGGVVPVKDYVSEMSVVSHGDGCQVRWSAEFEPLTGGPVDAVALVQDVYSSGLANAKVLLERGAS